eukprot:4233837-Amphidinium_carterae.5
MSGYICGNLATRDDSDSDDVVVIVYTIDNLNTIRGHCDTPTISRQLMVTQLECLEGLPNSMEKNPEFRERSIKVKADLTIHNVHIEDSMDEPAIPVETMDLCHMKDANVPKDLQYRDNKYRIQPTEEEGEELEDYNGLSVSIEEKRDDTSSLSQTLTQTLNDVLVHSTTLGSEPRSTIRHIMHASIFFET